MDAPSQWELFMNKPIGELIRECRNPRDDRVRQMCENDHFWEERVIHEFGKNIPPVETTWKDLYSDLYLDKKINQVIDNIFNKLRDDMYYKRKKITDKYNRKLRNRYREPKRCVGKSEYLEGVDIKDVLAAEREARTDEITGEDEKLENYWLLITGPKGKDERHKLKNQELDLTFINYRLGTAKTKKESHYYGVMFIGFTLVDGYYYYGTPDTVHDEEKPLVQFKFEQEMMPPEIDTALDGLFANRVPFIKLYMFISTTEVSPEDFKWVIEYNGVESAWSVSTEWTRYFIRKLFNDPELDETDYPIIMERTEYGSHKKLCGPWLKDIVGI